MMHLVEDIPEFIVNDSYVLSGRGQIYCGPAPFDMLDRNVKGKQVMALGRVRTIASLMSFAKLTGPRKGEPIGLMFE